MYASLISSGKGRLERQRQMSSTNPDDGTAPYAIWFLRLTLGIALLAHVELNLGGIDPAATARWLGLPIGVSAFGIVLEVVIAIALILGIWPRAAALAGVAVVFAAIMDVRGPSVFANYFNWKGPAVWMGALLLLWVLGDGAFVLVPSDSHLHKETRR